MIERALTTSSTAPGRWRVFSIVSVLFKEGSEIHTLAAGDCLAVGADAACTFANDGAGECRYIVAVARR